MQVEEPAVLEVCKVRRGWEAGLGREQDAGSTGEMGSSMHCLNNEGADREKRI